MRQDPDQVGLGHAARRAARKKRKTWRHLLPCATGTRDVPPSPAGGAARERGALGPRPSGVRTYGQGRRETKKMPPAAAGDGTRDVPRAPVGGTAGERSAPGPLLGHTGRRTMRRKRARRHLLPCATRTRDVRREREMCAPHLQEALQESAVRQDPDQVGLEHAARRAARQKKRTRPHLLPCATGTRDERPSTTGGTAGARGAPGPRPSGVRTHGQARRETLKSKMPPASAGNGA